MDASYLKTVIYLLGAVLVIAVGGIIFLSANEDAIPDVLQNVAVGALTAIAGILVPVRASNSAD